MQIWVAAGLALVCGSILTGLANFFVPILTAQIINVLGRNSAFASVLVSVILAVIFATALEVGKFGAIVWPLRRQWAQWAPLGATFGLVYAASLLSRWIIFGLRPDADISVYVGLIFLATKIALLHWALGRVAAAVAMRPGGPWIALITVSFVSALISLLPLEPARVFLDLPSALLTAPQWLLDIPLILFILAVWKWLPISLTHQAYGPARWIIIILAFFLFFFGWILFVFAVFFGPAKIDIVAFLLTTLAAGFLLVMLYRYVLRPWAMRFEQR